MARGELSKEEIRELKKNPNVISAEENRIVYSDAFKKHFMEEYKKGKRPRDIFQEAGFDPAVLGSKRIERASARWREADASGSLGKYSDGSVRHAEKKKNDSRQMRLMENKIRSLEDAVERLTLENQRLRKQLEEKGD
ncbi:MAG: hypothetical protein Q4C50_11470 [Eubacteriales bacterium]|nr:hypothetical protein [Eubacteriales bacterium]